MIAKRIQVLSNYAQSIGYKPFFTLDEKPQESYWDEFIIDFFIFILPILGGVPLLIGALKSIFEHTPNATISSLPLFFMVLGIGSLIKILVSYKEGYFPEKSVVSLLKTIKVSEVRPIPCTIKGKVIGRGIPGYVISEDFILQDETGIILLDYKQPLGLWENIFGLLKAEQYIDKEVIVTGWYRRAPVPKIEIKNIKTLDDSLESQTYFKSISIFWAFVFSIVGSLWFLSS